MAALAYRATVILRPSEAGSPLSLMERSFASEGDAVSWCEVMSAAREDASGVWLVAQANNGRIMTVRRESGFLHLLDFSSAYSAIVAQTTKAGEEPELSEEESAELAADEARKGAAALPEVLVRSLRDEEPRAALALSA